MKCCPVHPNLLCKLLQMPGYSTVCRQPMEKGDYAHIATCCHCVLSDIAVYSSAVYHVVERFFRFHLRCRFCSIISSVIFTHWIFCNITFFRRYPSVLSPCVEKHLEILHRSANTNLSVIDTLNIVKLINFYTYVIASGKWYGYSRFVSINARKAMETSSFVKL
jgi:hypothetical protein